VIPAVGYRQGCGGVHGLADESESGSRAADVDAATTSVEPAQGLGPAPELADGLFPQSAAV
jgi:hypothetical protein